MIYSFSPFGFEGSIITVEVDLRRGIPATDIVGLADVACAYGKSHDNTFKGGSLYNISRKLSVTLGIEPLSLW